MIFLSVREADRTIVKKEAAIKSLECKLLASDGLEDSRKAEKRAS
jgi:hypothetical protein